MALIAVASIGAGEAQLEAKLGGEAVERFGERVLHGLAALGELLLNPRAANAEGPELVEEERPVAVALEQLLKLAAGFCRRLATGLDALATAWISAILLLDLAVGQRQEQLLLAGEVGVDGPGGEASLRGDLLDARLVVAAPGEDHRRRVEQQLAGLLLPLAPGRTLVFISDSHIIQIM